MKTTENSAQQTNTTSVQQQEQYAGLQLSQQASVLTPPVSSGRPLDASEIAQIQGRGIITATVVVVKLAIKAAPVVVRAAKKAWAISNTNRGSDAVAGMLMHVVDATILSPRPLTVGGIIAAGASGALNGKITAANMSAPKVISKFAGAVGGALGARVLGY